MKRLRRFRDLVGEVFALIIGAERHFEFDSEALRTATYRPVSGELLVTFTSGRSYRYSDVGSLTFLGLIAASSRGRFFNHHVARQHPYEALS